MTNEKHVEQSILGLLRRSIEAQAKNDALEAMVLTLAAKNGIPEAKAKQAMAQVEKAALQHRLEQVEQADSSLAAELDRRPDRLDIDQFLP
jgi:hypothetical protein